MKNPCSEEVERALEHWQDRLRLRDWKIVVRLCHRSEITDGCMAEVSPNRFAGEATVLIGYPDEWVPADSEMHRDWEVNLVHELLHLPLLEFEKADGPKSREVAEERLCNSVAAALVMLARVGGTRKEGKDDEG